MKGLFIALARSPRPEQPNLHSLALSGERRELLSLSLPSSTQITPECSLLALFHPGLVKVEEFSMTIYESRRITDLLTHGLKGKMSNLYRPSALPGRRALLASSVNCNRANYGLSALVFCLRHCSATWRRRSVQGISKRWTPGCVKKGGKVAFCLPTAGRRAQLSHLIFTQPGAHLLEIP